MVLALLAAAPSVAQYGLCTNSVCGKGTNMMLVQNVDPWNATKPVGDTLTVATTGTDAGDCVSAVCKSITYALTQIADGDTITVADGTYTVGAVSDTCAFATGSTHINIADADCPQYGCTITATNVNDPPTVILSGEDLAVCITNSSQWTIRGIKFTSSIGFRVDNSDNITIKDSWLDYTEVGSGTISRFESTNTLTMSNVTTDNTQWGQGGCDVADDSNYQMYFVNAVGTVLEDSYFGHDAHFMMVRDTTDFVMRRCIVEHFTEHGIQHEYGSARLLFENNIFRGDTACSYTTQTNTGPRIFDIYAVDDLLVRNNTIVGHGYDWQTPITGYEQQAQCLNGGLDTGYDHDFGSGTQDVRICQRTNVRFFNNIIYDIGDSRSASSADFIQFLDSHTVMPGTGGTLDIVEQSAIQFTNNYYAKGPEGPEELDHGFVIEVSVVANDPFHCALNDGDSEFDYTCAGFHRDGRGCDAWDGTKNAGVNSIYDATSGADPDVVFVDYDAQNYIPATDSALIDAGNGGQCAAHDFFGNPRSSPCDIGAIEKQ